MCNESRVPRRSPVSWFLFLFIGYFFFCFVLFWFLLVPDLSLPMFCCCFVFSFILFFSMLLRFSFQGYASESHYLRRNCLGLLRGVLCRVRRLLLFQKENGHFQSKPEREYCFYEGWRWCYVQSDELNPPFTLTLTRIPPQCLFFYIRWTSGLVGGGGQLQLTCIKINKNKQINISIYSK